MSSLSIFDANFIGTVFEGLFYGLYCIVFFLYIQVHTSKKSADRNNLIYPLSTLFVLCTVYFALDFLQQYLTVMRGQKDSFLVWNLDVTTSAIYSFIDFIGQGVLIYRCWVVWNRRLLVVVIPLILALASLATSLTLVVALYSFGQLREFSEPPSWFTPIGVSSFSLSLAVNATFTGLLVFKIISASADFRQSLPGNTQRGNELRALISMLIESGVVLFVMQLIWVIFFRLNSNGFYLIGGMVAMLYGTIPTLIVVRVGMRDAYKHQTSSVESDMRFALADENRTTRTPGNTFKLNSRLRSNTASQRSLKGTENGKL